MYGDSCLISQKRKRTKQTNTYATPACHVNSSSPAASWPLEVAVLLLLALGRDKEVVPTLQHLPRQLQHLALDGAGQAGNQRSHQPHCLRVRAWPERKREWFFNILIQINNCASKFYSQTQDATDYNAHRSVMEGWGGGGGGYRHTDQNNGSLCVYFIIQIPPFIDWTCGGGEECGATAEITQSLQIDLVLSDVAATSKP